MYVFVVREHRTVVSKFRELDSNQQCAEATGPKSPRRLPIASIPECAALCGGVTMPGLGCPWLYCYDWIRRVIHSRE